MAIDRIPGVGPANSDIAAATAAVVPNSAAITAAVPTAAQIATAVAAPSAATIAAAVAAPSAATIAAAVAAPSSATIATAVAAAVPTIGAINTSVANNAPSSNAWTLLATGNLQNLNTATASFSSYRKLRVVFKIFCSGSTGQIVSLRVNGDTSGIYSTAYNFTEINGQTNQFINNTDLRTSSGNLANDFWNGYLEIIAANSTSAKAVNYQCWGGLNGAGQRGQIEGVGVINNTSAITSITVFDPSGSLFATNSINSNAFFIYGAN